MVVGGGAGKVWGRKTFARGRKRRGVARGNLQMGFFPFTRIAQGEQRFLYRGKKHP